jgi:hypothetical protein
MPGEFDPQHWRDRAKEARVKADRMEGDLRAKRRLLGLAEFYEGIAKRLVERDWRRRRLHHAVKPK